MPFRVTTILIALSLGFVTACNRTLPAIPDSTLDRLYILSDAYLAAANALDRAPKNMRELAKYLPPDQSATDLLNSPNDGKPYVLVWHIDPRQPPETEIPPLLAYEQEGLNGTYCVLTTMGVAQLDSQEFEKHLAITPGVLTKK